MTRGIIKQASFPGILTLVGLWNLFALAQNQWPWPVTPFNQSQLITGAFAEYRSTSPTGHFHNGTDIPKPDGSPVYPVKDGIVTSIGTVATQGSNAFVRIQDIAYVHINPNPSLSVGDSVFASQTILGTILPGLGHVHFTNGFVGSEKNSLLPNRGLTPYNDPWVPIIRFVRFYQNNTSNEFTNRELSGLVDIIVKVDEQNGPPGSSTSVLNNGTYKIGYKILSADSGSVVFEPPNNGVRFQFDTKPSNSYVNIVYFRPLSSTSSHVYQVTNNVNGDNFWNTAAIPEDDYLVMVFTEDTRGNADTAYVSVRTTEADLLPPQQPVLKMVSETEDGMLINWFPNTDEDLLGYRLYFSFDNRDWSLFRDEKVLHSAVEELSIRQVLNQDVYFRLTAVDDAPVPNESVTSDVYGMSNGSFIKKVLIVDGFDRSNGGWNQPRHDFAFTHGRAVISNEVSFDTAPNEVVQDRLVDLNRYDAVIWILGDESTEDETFSQDEQAAVKEYLEAGGALFVSGSEIARDLDPDSRAGNPAGEDEQFLNEYLRAAYQGQNPQSVTVTGVDGAIFAGLSFNFGQNPYPVAAPDIIVPAGESSIACLTYNDSSIAGVQYAGSFGEGGISGKLVYLAFPFETIADEQIRKEVMRRIMEFFFQLTGVKTPPVDPAPPPTAFALLPNYPNPFNPRTTIEYHLPVRSKVTIEIFNTLGQRVRTLIDGPTPVGRHTVTWNGRNEAGLVVPSGMYLLRLNAAVENTSIRIRKTRKLLFIK